MLMKCDGRIFQKNLAICGNFRHVVPYNFVTDIFSRDADKENKVMQE